MLLASREDQLELEYRLDGTFDHWLLDEFQDTSGIQWRAMANLIDEVVQDPSGERSFFLRGRSEAIPLPMARWRPAPV